MRSRHASSVALLALFLTAFGSSFLRAQTSQPGDREGVRRAIAEAALPGPEHERLAALSGTWSQEITYWPGPGADSVVLEAEATARMILGGRFLEVHSVVSPPLPIESITILGFDRRHGEYTVVGLDTWGTYWVTARGGEDGGDRVLMRGEDTDPLMGHTQAYDITLEFLGPEAYASEVVFHDEAHTHGGGPFRAVRIVNRRP